MGQHRSEMIDVDSVTPSGHFVVALPLNFRVTAFIFALLETRRSKLPRSIAVLPVETSFCSNPCRNNTGSANETDAVIPLPEAIGFSSGIAVLLSVRPDVLLAADRPISVAREGRDMVPGTGPLTSGRAPGRMVSVSTISRPSSPRELVDGRASGSDDRVEDAEDGTDDGAE